jgi:hypothetical protein
MMFRSAEVLQDVAFPNDVWSVFALILLQPHHRIAALRAAGNILLQSPWLARSINDNQPWEARRCLGALV